MTSTPPVPASNTRTFVLGNCCKWDLSVCATKTPAPSSERVEFPQPITQSTGRSAGLYTPQAAEPVRLDRYRKFRQIAPFAVDQVVHALLTAHFILAVGIVRESGQNQLGF